jgi:ABC-2 type transport system ATP-binding protein
MDYAVTINKVSKYFPKPRGLREIFLLSPTQQVMALEEVDLNIAKGSIFGLLGPNGSGKTTLQKIICNLLVPNSGSVSLTGKASYVFEGDRTFYWRLTGWQNLEFFAALSGLSPEAAKQQIPAMTRLLDMEGHLDKPFGSFSAGNRQKLSLIRALITDPAILVMDEPTRSLDPGIALQVCELAKELVRKKEKTIIWATHNLAEAETICAQVALLSQGRIAAETSAAGVSDTYFNLIHPKGQVAVCE